MSNGDTNSGAVTELRDRITRLETNLSFWKAIVAAAIVFLGLGTGYGVYSLYQRMLEIVEVEVAEQAIQDIIELREQAAQDATTIRGLVKSNCYDPTWVDATGQCIYLFLPEGRYSLNYGSAVAACTAHGARLCTLAEVQSAYNNGAEWCAWSWVSDLEVVGNVRDVQGTIAYPYQQQGQSGCSYGLNVESNMNIMTMNAGAACCL